MLLHARPASGETWSESNMGETLLEFDAAFEGWNRGKRQQSCSILHATRTSYRCMLDPIQPFCLPKKCF